ncbi:MAG: ABC transporter ATP-binding protein [Proteobacteria bacterium]|jgi:putative ABC transport system ATP-binding protein|nr:ABC transporter ATP-binding protein [Pseudomonadota bacterium]
MSVVLDQVVKDYPLGSSMVRALHSISLRIEEGEFTTIAGPSGCGKSTLLNLIGCMDVATEGHVSIEGKETGLLTDKEQTHLRLNTLGFIFQSFNLVPVLSVFQNVELPLLLKGGMTAAQRAERVNALLDQVGLGAKAKNRSHELSGGQRQRVAIARALVTLPKIVLADEPTANLDSETGKTIIELMRSLNEKQKTTFIFSSHDPKVIEHARRIVRLQDGRVIEDVRK